MFQNPEMAFGGSVPMLGLIENIYACVQVPEVWTCVMEGISQALGGESIALFAGFGDANTPDVMALSKMDADVWASYATYYAAVNPIMHSCERMFAPGTTWRSDRAISDAALEKTEFYNDFFKQADMHYSVGMRIPLDGPFMANVSCQRSSRQGAFGDNADVVYQTLLPHLQRSLKLYHQMGAMKTAMLGLETALEAHGQAVMGVDALGQVVVCNPLATAMVQAGDGVRLVQGRLVCSRAEDSRALQGMLASVMVGGVGGAMLVHRRDKRALRVTVSAFRGSLPGRSAMLSALVYLSDPAQSAPSRAVVMRELYGLTATEGRVADLLLEGLEVRELGERMHITLETARFQVKRVLAKTGARKQSELMRLMLGLPAVG